MLTIRVSGTSLKMARTTLLGWSLQELAARSGVNWLTIKKIEPRKLRDEHKTKMGKINEVEILKRMIKQH